MLNQVGFDQS